MDHHNLYPGHQQRIIQNLESLPLLIKQINLSYLLKPYYLRLFLYHYIDKNHNHIFNRINIDFYICK